MDTDNILNKLTEFFSSLPKKEKWYNKEWNADLKPKQNDIKKDRHLLCNKFNEVIQNHHCQTETYKRKHTENIQDQLKKKIRPEKVLLDSFEEKDPLPNHGSINIDCDTLNTINSTSNTSSPVSSPSVDIGRQSHLGTFTNKKENNSTSSDNSDANKLETDNHLQTVKSTGSNINTLQSGASLQNNTEICFAAATLNQQSQVFQESSSIEQETNHEENKYKYSVHDISNTVKPSEEECENVESLACTSKEYLQSCSDKMNNQIVKEENEEECSEPISRRSAVFPSPSKAATIQLLNLSKDGIKKDDPYVKRALSFIPKKASEEEIEDVEKLLHQKTSIMNKKSQRDTCSSSWDLPKFADCMDKHDFLYVDSIVNTQEVSEFQKKDFNTLKERLQEDYNINAVVKQEKIEISDLSCLAYLHHKSTKESLVRLFTNHIVSSICFKTSVKILHEYVLGDKKLFGVAPRCDYAIHCENSLIGAVELKAPSAMNKNAMVQLMIQLLKIQFLKQDDSCKFLTYYSSQIW